MGLLEQNPNIFSQSELEQLLGGVGKNLKIDRNVQFVGPKKIFLGSNVRIDSQCILIGGEGIHIGDYVHIAWGCHLTASGATITLESFTGLSSGVKIFSATDDYSEGHLTNPTVDVSYKKVRSGPVLLCRHSIIGANSVVMPGVVIELGASVGALSFINKRIPKFSIVSGNPPRLVGRRNGERLLDLEKEFLNAQCQ